MWGRWEEFARRGAKWEEADSVITTRPKGTFRVREMVVLPPIDSSTLPISHLLPFV